MALFKPNLLLGCIAALLGCSSDPLFEGPTAQPIAFTLEDLVPVVGARVDDRAQQPLVVDTGAPFTVLAAADFAPLPQGPQTVAVEALGLRFPRLDVIVRPLRLAAPGCAETAAHGLLGADILGPFRVALDYRQKQIRLLDGGDEAPPPAGGVRTPQPFALLGGGTFDAGGGQRVSVGPTRIVVGVQLEGVLLDAILDTGAALNVISSTLAAQLPGADRPRLCCRTTYLASGQPVSIPRTRLRSLTIGGQRLESQPALVIAPEPIMRSLSAETGREIQLILGTPVLRELDLVVDYGGQQLALAPYPTRDHIDPGEFIGPGYHACRSGAQPGALVVDVYEGTDAARQGLQPGDLIVGIDGQPVTEADDDRLEQLMAGRPVGSSVTLTVQRGTQGLSLTILVEDLLPHYR